DAQVLEALQGSLVQLVRNAVAHGIETPAERTLAGKPAAGRVCVEAEQSGYQVMLRCRDDGRGVDLEAVRKAIERRGASPQAVRELGTGELVAALLHGGISTSEVVTELAGRGVGLDVVRDAVQRLGGSVAVHTEATRGSTIELKVPVSLSVLEVLSVQAGGQRAAIPLSAVRRVLRLAPHEITRVPGGDAVVHEGTSLTLRPLPLGRGAGPRGTSGPVSAVVLHTAGLTCALTVDRLLGVVTVVARPLPPLAPADAIVGGVHFDADGTPCLLLDPAALAAEPAPGNETAPAVATPRPVLVVDDSPTTRMLESSILTSAGFAVDVASSAEEALQMAQQRDYGLFLVDIEMPGLDGFGFIERVRGQARLREVPCVLVSSRDSPQDRRRGEQVGARAYIAKSDFDQNDFLRRVAELALR
ncbi:MAG TPA: response regulator, partial [Burkholderiaceae bacterium]|nr:response regulator [Burkholderiaceae bacterium]